MQVNDNEILWKVALSMVKGVTSLIVVRMEEVGMTPEEFMTRPAGEVMNKLGLNADYPLDLIHREEKLHRAESEVAFMKTHGIKGLFLNDDDYPWRLKDVDVAPVMLYQLGDCNLNCEHPMSVVGTRRITPYGAGFCSKFVKEMGDMFPDMVIVSGLAFGADAIAHRAAIESGVKTVGVLAHGLNTIYPAAHRDLAKWILNSGGALISEYPSGTTPYRANFLERNRIVAGLSDAVVIIESEVKGGAMSTANHAFRFNRDIFALPGRVSDPISAGCNLLIQRNKAHLLTSASDMLEVLDWQPAGLQTAGKARTLFNEPEGDGKLVFDFIKSNGEPTAIDVIHQQLQIPVGRLMSLLGELEFDGLVLKHPGNRYEIAP